MNVEEVFPQIDERTQVEPIKLVKREKLNQLQLPEFYLEAVPSPWRLFKTGNEYELQFGSNSDIKINLIHCFNGIQWRNEDYWQNEWERITGLKVKSDRELIFDEVGNMEMVTFKSKDWIPVLTWIKPKDGRKWGLLFRTELNRMRGDINELKNLLKKIN